MRKCLFFIALVAILFSCSNDSYWDDLSTEFQDSEQSTRGVPGAKGDVVVDFYRQISMTQMVYGVTLLDRLKRPVLGEHVEISFILEFADMDKNIVKRYIYQDAQMMSFSAGLDMSTGEEYGNGDPFDGMDFGLSAGKYYFRIGGVIITATAPDGVVRTATVEGGSKDYAFSTPYNDYSIIYDNSWIPGVVKERRDGLLGLFFRAPHFIIDFKVFFEMNIELLFDIAVTVEDNPSNVICDNIGFSFSGGTYDYLNNAISNQVWTWWKTGNPYLGIESIKRDDRDGQIGGYLLRFVKGVAYLPSSPLYYESSHKYPDHDFVMGGIMDEPGRDWSIPAKYGGLTNDVKIEVFNSGSWISKQTVRNKKYSNNNGTVYFETYNALYTINLIHYMEAEHPYGLPKFKPVVN